MLNPEADLPGNRFNDGKVDRRAVSGPERWTTAKGSARGTLYRVDTDLACAKVDTGYRVTNGPAFSPVGDTMYHNDSARQVTYAFDLDETRRRRGTAEPSSNSDEATAIPTE